MAKIIFLDVDGVFASKRAHLATSGGMVIHWNAWDALAVRFMNDNFGPESGWQVVISSTWGKTFNFQAMMDIMGAAGLRLKVHNEWRTPEVGHYQRGEEIKLWLEQNEPDVIKNGAYIIVDDNADMLEEQANNFVQTDTDNGILAAHYLQLKNLKKDIDNRVKA